MGLDFNKVFMAVLSIALFVFAITELAGHVYGTAPHHGHGDHHYDTKTEWAKSEFPGYWEEIPEVSKAVEVIEKVFDLGAALRSADLVKGERAFKACVSCHTTEQGGANIKGPNLYGIVGSAIAGKSGFKYSTALATHGGQWDYASLNSWLQAPQKFAKGSTMVLATRKDSERANLIAYLATYSPDAPEFPEPLAQPEPAIAEVAAELDDASQMEVVSMADEPEEASETVDAGFPENSQETEEAAEELDGVSVE